MGSNDARNEKKSPADLKISRRGFLRAAGIVGGSLVIGSQLPAKRALAVEEFPGNPDRYGMLTDTTKCIGCRLCETACAKANGLPGPAEPPADKSAFAKLRRPSAEALTVVNRYPNPEGAGDVFRKLQCMHCNEPACASACLVGAIKKTHEGMVLYNESVCIGCRYCIAACPFNNLAYDYNSAFTPAVRKCTMCYQRVVSEGKLPACAEVCPPKATIFGKRSDLLRIAKDRIRQNPNWYVDHVYGENEAGGTSWLYISSVPFERLGLPTDLGTTPLPEYTRDFLLGVPVMYVMWPPILAGIAALAKRREQVAKEEKGNGHNRSQEVPN